MQEKVTLPELSWKLISEVTSPINMLIQIEISNAYIDSVSTFCSYSPT